MGVIFDYFAAPSDAEATAVIDRSPDSRLVDVQVTRGLLRRKTVTVWREDPSLPVYETVSVKGIDPVVQLGTLEEILTGVPYDDVMDDPRSGLILAERVGGEVFVVAITDTLLATLANAATAQLDGALGPWVATEEFGAMDIEEADGVRAFMDDLADLSRNAPDGHHLYCRVCV